VCGGGDANRQIGAASSLLLAPTATPQPNPVTHPNPVPLPNPPHQQVREDITDALQRLAPSRDEEGAAAFSGWSKMALPFKAFRITEVARPRVGELRPASVSGELVIDTRGLRGDMAREWDDLRQHDVLFLMGGGCVRVMGGWGGSG